jgi:hypothetical protein
VNAKNDKAASILANSSGMIRFRFWDQGQSVWRLVLEIPAAVFIHLNDRAEVQTQIEVAANTAIESYTDASFEVRIVAGTGDSNDWRGRVNQYLSGEGLTNQGRVHSGNIAAREHEGLLFRSLPEVHFYSALKGTGIPFAPLAVVVRGGTTYNRVAPDFLILKDGVVMLVEIDGPYHFETLSQAFARLKFITDENVKSERIPSTACDSPEKAREAVRRIVATIDKLRLAR